MAGLTRHEKIMEILPGDEVIIRCDGFTRVTSYWGVVDDGKNTYLITPENTNMLCICIRRKKILRVRFDRRPFYGDVLLVWKEYGVDELQFLAIHATAQKAKAVKLRTEVQSRADLNFYMRAFLDLAAYISLAITADKVAGLIETGNKENP